MDEREAQVRDLFAAAVVLRPSEWAGFLQENCADPEIRARVQKLLDLHSQSEDFLSRPAINAFPDLSEPVGDRLGEFRIVREIGRGGMGVVYLAEDTQLKRIVALKVLPPSIDGDQIAADRFAREAQAVARLTHPGIVQVYRNGEERGFAYIAMEYVLGGTLRDYMAPAADPRGPTAAASEADEDPPVPTDRARIREIAGLISEIADALEHAHRHGVIHRDVKPSNILIDNERRARLTDFGLARIVSERTLSNISQIAGSFPYMSPEQAQVQSGEVDHRTDIFSLGVVLYELLTRERPFDGATPQEIMRALMEREPRKVRQLNPAVPIDLVTITHKAIEKTPDDRYQSAEQMAADLRCFLDDRHILAAPPNLLKRSRRFVRHNRQRVAASGVVFLIGIIGLQFTRQQLAARRSMGRLSIVDAEHTSGAAVYAARWNNATRSLDPRVPIGTLPLENRRLQRGVYRILVIAESRQAEFDAVLSRGGEAIHTVWLRDPAAQTDGMVPFGGDAMPAQFFDPLDGTQTPGPLNLPRFWLDRNEVTNEEFRKYVDATGAPAPQFWNELGDAPFSSIADRPVVDITRAEMQRYASWRGKRLPTVYEWLAAAQAPDGRAAPWGDRDPPADLVPSVEMLLAEQERTPKALVRNYLAYARPVNQPSSERSPLGLDGMFGNVMEMTATVALADGENDDARPTCAIFAGGCWVHDPGNFTLRTASQYPLDGKFTQLGFRCTLSAAPSEQSPSPDAPNSSKEPPNAFRR